MEPQQTLISCCFYLLTLCFFSQVFASSSTDSSIVLTNEALPTKSGYLPIAPKSESAIFYAYYEAQSSKLPLAKTPLIFWLQGGPGCSSMIGNFLELGPFRVIDSYSLVPNEGSWNRIFGLVFLDNPIGTGFSIAASKEEIPKDQRNVAKQLYGAISAFFDTNSDSRGRPIYIAGESYAGKYVPAIGYFILEKNTRLHGTGKINLQGVAIGNGLVDPFSQVKTHANSAYYTGLINKMQKNSLKEAQSEASELVKLRNWTEATNARNKVLNLLQNVTGLATLYDYTRAEPYKTSLVTEMLQSDRVKKALGANESIHFEECSDVVGDILHEDVMKSTRYMVEFLVKRSKVLLYQGIYDLRDGVVSTEAWVKGMKWEEIRNFLMAERKVWKVNGKLAGYVQKWSSLSNCVVLGAGHLVPTDQPVNSQAMIEDWVLDRGAFANEAMSTASE